LPLTKEFLRRYTDLPALIHLLNTKSITFLNPSLWDDKNDAYFMSLYKQRLGLTSLLALCCSRGSETYHHWRVFSNGPSGVCVSFKREVLVNILSADGTVRSGEVEYLTMQSLKGSVFDIARMPFLKRAPYRPEHEFRFIYESKTTNEPFRSYPIPLDCIDTIYLSPWMPKVIADKVRTTLRQIDGVRNISIWRSTLVGNDDWQKYGEKLVSL
jgi:hypothetical protein